MSDRIEALMRYLVTFDRAGKSPTDFWSGFDALAGDLPEEVWSDDADPELRERYTDLLAAADDAGYAVPPEMMERKWD